MMNLENEDGLHIVYNQGYLTAHLKLRTNSISPEEVHNINNFIYQAVNAFESKEVEEESEN
tara:strand:+ start:399 stop:581 length:183 start_codon:yes stop_codon:yes gene_type:complete